MLLLAGLTRMFTRIVTENIEYVVTVQMFPESFVKLSKNLADVAS